MRSDWESNPDDEEDGERGFGKPGRSNSIFIDEDTIKEKAEVDEKVSRYVKDQLHRLQSPEATDRYQDELEAQLDEKWTINGH
jgi:hypothetical protein